MKIFITGGSGFIGGAIIEALKGTHTLFAMARSEQSLEKVEARGATGVPCELGKIQPEHLKDCEVVIHAAAFVEPWGTREQFWQTNVVGTEQLLEVAKEANVKRFIHIGTEAALFNGQDLVDIDETYPYPTPQKYLYSETKAEAEKRVLAANVPGTFETISLRPRLVWGPNDTTILPNIIQLVDKGAFRWIDQGRLLTSTTHVANLVEGVRLALTRGRGGEAYFITDGKPHTMREFLTKLLATADRIPKNKNMNSGLLRFAAGLIEGIWRLLGLKSKPPITRFSAAIMSSECTLKIEKAQAELGYQPVISVQDGLAELAFSE